MPDTSTEATTQRALLKVIRRFCKTHGIAESTFGRLAVNDGKFVGRIEAGSRIETETARRVDAFIAQVEAGEIVLRGRPRRKKAESSAFLRFVVKMARPR